MVYLYTENGALKMPTTVISFRAPEAMVRQLAELGATTENSRANTVYLLLVAALSGQAADTLRILKARP